MEREPGDLERASGQFSRLAKEQHQTQALGAGPWMLSWGISAERSLNRSLVAFGSRKHVLMLCCHVQMRLWDMPRDRAQIYFSEERRNREWGRSKNLSNQTVFYHSLVSWNPSSLCSAFKSVLFQLIKEKVEPLQRCAEMSLRGAAGRPLVTPRPAWHF